MPKTKNEKRLKALENMNCNASGSRQIATYFIASVPYRKLKEVCEALGIYDEDIKDL